MHKRTATANAAKSKARARVGHVFARKRTKRLLVGTIGIKRVEANITLASLVYNMHRLIFHERRTPMAWALREGRKSDEN
jgi:hypothetical protein